MLRVRELAATGMERSSVKAGMTGESVMGHRDRGGSVMTGGRAWRPGMETGHGDWVRNPDHGRPVNPFKIPLKRYSFTY